MLSIEQQLSDSYRNFLNKFDVYSLDLDLSNSLTKINSTHSAFRLNLDGKMQRVEPLDNQQKDYDSLLVVANISYFDAHKMISDQYYGYYILSIYKNAMLKEIFKEVSMNDIETITFTRPGRVGEILFRELENVAAFELRLFVKLKERSKTNE